MTTQAGGGESSANDSDAASWPLHKISEPHERNDVLLSIPDSSNNQRQSSDSSPSEDEPPIPWRSIHLNSRRQESVSFRGNQRFFGLLQKHQEDYERRSKMEKPLVTVKVLQEWRSQTPPGRFLIVENTTNPPLWKDIGDKKARSKISKALKHSTKAPSAALISGSQSPPQQSPTLTPPAPESSSPPFAAQETAAVLSHMPAELEVNEISKISSTVRSFSDLSIGSTSGVQALGESATSQQSPDLITSLIKSPLPSRTVHRPSTRNNAEEEEKKASESLPIQYTPPKLTLPRIPTRFSKPERFVRRISEQLHSAQEGGSIYGRWSERDQLTTIYQRQKPQKSPVDFVLISGLMGVGKTSLAQTLKNPMIDTGGHEDCGYEDNDEEEDMEWPFFLRGKFEHCRWSDPNAFFVSIVADFCQHLGQRNDPNLTRRYRNALVDGLKDDILLLSTLCPALETLLKKPHGKWGSTASCSMDTSDPCCPLSDQPQTDSFACMAMQRIKEVFGKFLQIIASVDPSKHTVIVLLDDLHFASEPAVDVLTSLATNRCNKGVLFVGTYRDDEADERHFTKALLQWDHNQNVNVTKFHLENLREDSVHLMLADALSLQEEETRSLNNLVYSLTKGNPTFITELLRVFQDKGLLRYEESSQQWTYDLQQIPMLGNIDSVPGLFKAKVLALPHPVRETLKIAACLWSTEIDEPVLKMIDTVGAAAAHLKTADIMGLLTCRSGQYAFVSDGVKQATYDLIPAAERASYHLKIGQRLWLHLEEHENPSFYALLMSQMMMADDVITAGEDRRAVASLCLEAGHGAAKHLGFQTSWLCLSHGISIVSAQKTWGRENYDLSLSLYNTAIEVCYCNAEFKELQNLIEEVLENARTFEDSLLARSTQIYWLGSRNNQVEAIKLGLHTLKPLGVNFPSMHPPRWRIYLEARRLKTLLRGLSDEDILKLPRMKDPKKLAAMQIMNHFMLYAYYTTPNLAALLAFRMVELTIKSGMSAISCIGFVLYGTILCRLDAIDEGYRYGKLAIRISASFKQAVWLCRTWAGYYGTIHSRKHTVHEAIEPLRTAHRAGMRTGDIEYSLLNACIVIFNCCEVIPLPELEAELRELAVQTDFYGQTLSFVLLKPLWQMVLNLMGKAEGDPKILQGQVVNDDVRQAEAGKNPHFGTWAGFSQLKLAYLFGDYDLAAKYTHDAREIYNNSSGATDCVLCMTYECLTQLALARQGKQRLRRIFHVKRCIKRLKLWAMHAPMNFLHKQFFLEAELASVCGDRQKAISHYRSAILHSRESNFILDEALANEQLGRFYLESDDNELAVPFLRGARDVYEKWGGKAKVAYFEEEFGGTIDCC